MCLILLKYLQIDKAKENLDENHVQRNGLSVGRRWVIFQMDG